MNLVFVGIRGGIFLEMEYPYLAPTVTAEPAARRPTAAAANAMMLFFVSLDDVRLYVKPHRNSTFQLCRPPLPERQSSNEKHTHDSPDL